MGSFIGFFFSPAGRFRRLDYWMHFLLTLLFWVAIAVFLAFHWAEIVPPLHDDAEKLSQQLSQDILVMFLVAMLAAFLLTVSSVMAVIKRFHDFGSSGWNFFWMIVPFVNIYFGFKLMFFRGDEGDNAYGPSPYRTVTL